MTLEILTVGHSTLEYEEFLGLLRKHNVTAIADVRSSPQSRAFPQFSQEMLKQGLQQDGIRYVFLGEELGGRPKGAEFYCDGIADYELMATADSFKRGIDRVIGGAEKYRIALMCSEHSPLDCHRCLLVGRALKVRGVRVMHILQSGETRSQDQIESQLLQTCGHGGDDMFAKGQDRIAGAYRERSRQVSYRKPIHQGGQIAAK